MKAMSLVSVLKLGVQFPFQLYGLSRRPYWSREKLVKYQLGHLNHIVNLAKNKVDLYQERLRGVQKIESLTDLSQIPILYKKDLLEAPVNNRLNKDYAIEDLIVSKSSGSSGQALDVYYDLESFNYFILAGLRMYNMMFDYKPWHKQTYIYTSPYPLNSLLGLYPLNFISTLTPITETIKKLKNDPPDFLVCYPSHLRSIVDQMSPEDFKRIRPLAINVNSEMSTARERQYLGEKFNTTVYDEYSSEELTRIASQCKYLNYHIFEDINYIEIVNSEGKTLPEGQVGFIVGTNLHNKAMPLIRYAQGDRGAIVQKTCNCGRTFRVLQSFEGRANDSFMLSSGELISSGYLLDLTYGVFLNYTGAVRAFCLIQESPENWVLELVPGEAWNQDLAVTIKNELSKSINKPQVQLVTKIVNEVTKTKSGKANPIISKVKRS